MPSTEGGADLQLTVLPEPKLPGVAKMVGIQECGNLGVDERLQYFIRSGEKGK